MSPHRPHQVIPRGAHRPSPLAGRWYPADAAALTAEVEGYLEDARASLGPRAERLTERLDPRFILAPHAGLIYSGPVAAEAWLATADLAPERIVIVAPAHRVAFEGVAVGDFETFTVGRGGGERHVAVDRARLGLLVERFPEVVGFVPGAHDEEHAIEIQLPFALALHPGVPIVPLLAGRVATRALVPVIQAALEGAGDQDLARRGEPRRGGLLVVSSDLSHFHPYDDARALDLGTLAEVRTLTEGALSGERACGYRGLAAALVLARGRGYAAELIDYRSSGDTAGDRDSVVGYGAAAFGPRLPAL
jgi:hypothetical protein